MLASPYYCLWLVAILFTIHPSHASNFNEPHPHQGKVTPFEPGEPNVKLDSKALKILKSGQPYKTQIQSGSSGRGLVVQDVMAPTSVVWDRILDYNNYAKMVPKTVESQNYNVIIHKPPPKPKQKSPTQTIYTRMKVGFPILKLEFFVKHLYYPHFNSLTWTLDYTKTSDFDDSCGYWYVIPHPERPEDRTRVYYSVQVGMFDWVPKFVMEFMSSKALVDATAWVKKFSELEWDNEQKKRSLDTATGGEVSSASVSSSGSVSVDGGGGGGGNPILEFFGGNKRRKMKLEEEAARLKEELAAKERAIEEEKSKTMVIRWTRVVLVSAVGILILVNLSVLLSSS